MTEQQEQEQTTDETKIAEIKISMSYKKLFFVFDERLVKHLIQVEQSQFDSFSDDLTHLIIHTLSTIKEQREQISQSEIVNKDA